MVTTLTTIFFNSREIRYPCIKHLKQPFLFEWQKELSYNANNHYFWFIANNDRIFNMWEHNADNYFLNLSSWNIHAYHLYSTTSTTISLVENENFDFTVFKLNSNNQFFRLPTRMFWHKRQSMKPVFHNSISRLMYPPQQRHSQCFLFRLRGA